MDEAGSQAPTGAEQFEGVVTGFDMESGETQQLVAPELAIDVRAPEISESARAVLDVQWQKFWELRNQQISAQESKGPEPFLEPGALVHNTVNNSPEALRTILDSGILSGELGYKGKATTPEDSETHYCADFFVNLKERTVPEYTAYAQGLEENDNGVLKRKRMESYASPSDQNDHISFVVDPDQPGLEDLLSLSSNGADLSNLGEFPVRLPVADDDGGKAARLKAVLVGIPANFISSIVVGGTFAANQEALAVVESLLAERGLGASVVDTQGRKLR